MRSLGRGAALAACLALAASLTNAPAAAQTVSPAPAKPASVFGFTGIPQGVDGFEPSDSSGALGKSFYLTAVNSSYAVWNLDGTVAIPPTPLESLTTEVQGMDVYDPKVIYDAYADEFVLVNLGQRDAPRGSIIVITAIPDATADDPTTWCITPILGDQVPSDVARWADYPSIGLDADRFVVSTNQFTFPSSTGTFGYAQVLSFDKAGLYDCSGQPTFTTFADAATRSPDGSRAFTIQPAQTVGAPTTSQYLLSFQGPGPDSSLTLWRLAETATGLRLRSTAIPVGRVRDPRPGTQGGGSLTIADTKWDTGDDRLVNAFYDADRNRLYTAHAVERNLRPDTITGGYPESVVRWYEVGPAGALKRSTLARSGIVGQPETDAGWPVVATDGDGNLLIAYSRASRPLGEYLSAWAAEIPPGSTTASTVLLVGGTAFHEVQAGVERWGDFNGIDRDPVDPSRIAMVNQIATPGSVSTWQQVVNVVTAG